ncbi:hypothetical protein [Streptomyces paradoxus]|uniref:hypothetical protein n=1 Tax=Streptomyces paradoxus TaxID=66375 RepID=UPI0037D28FF0
MTHPNEQAPTTTVGAPPAALSSDLDTAVRVAQSMLAAFGSSDRDGFSYPEAYGALRESLHLVLRALGAEGLRRSHENPSDQRCPAAHPEDPTPCGGPVVVTVLDGDNVGADGCELHAVRLLASLVGGRPVAKPDAPDGIAPRIFHEASRTRPFAWREVGQ